MNPCYQFTGNDHSQDTSAIALPLGQMSTRLHPDCTAGGAECEPILDLDEGEFNEEFLKALLDGADFGTTETASLNSTNNPQQDSPSVGEQCSSSSSFIQQACLPNQLDSAAMLFQVNNQAVSSSVNVHPVSPSSVASHSKRSIKPRTQLSNEDITTMLLVYMSKALVPQQAASATSSTSGSMQSCNSAASNIEQQQHHHHHHHHRQQQPRSSASNLSTKEVHHFHSENVTTKSKRKCSKSKSAGTERVFEPMDCGISASKEMYQKSDHTKVRPYNSLELPKVTDPLGLMDQAVSSRAHSTKVAGTSVGIAKGDSGTAGIGSSEMDLSPLTQILQTVTTVPSLETASNHKNKQKGPAATNKKSPKVKLQNDTSSTKVPMLCDQVAPISDMFSTVSNLPNLSDIQSVLKYVQKRKAMRKFFKRRSRSAGSIDDLKKESNSSASLKAYIELLKAKSQHLQSQVVPIGGDLQSCMITQSAVTDDDFEFLWSIGIDPNLVTTKQDNLRNLANVEVNKASNSNMASSDKMQQDVRLKTKQLAGFDYVHSKDSLLSSESPSENFDSQLLNVVHQSSAPTEVFPIPHIDIQPSGLEDNDIQYIDHASPNVHMLTDAHTEKGSDNVMAQTMPGIWFTPGWANSQGMIKIFIHGPFISSDQCICYFGDSPVDAKLEQGGILSCVCPGHNPGLVTLKVVVGQTVYTCPQQFEYKSPFLTLLNSSFSFDLKENTWRSDLLYKIKLLAKGCSAVTSEVDNALEENRSVNISHSRFGQLVMYLLERLKLVGSVLSSLQPNCRTTILHIVVLLNLENVVKKIKELVCSNVFHCSWESEFSPWTQDEEMCSPLMLSCQLGNIAISKLLLEWEPETVALMNSDGVTPIQCALQRGHSSLVAELEHWIKTISCDHTEIPMAENTEATVQQGPYSCNIYPMSSELYATDLEDILQSSGNDLLQGHQLDADKELKLPAGINGHPETSLATHSNSSSLNISDNTVTGVDLGCVERFRISPSPMFITANPCVASNNNGGLTVNELASGSSSMFNSSPVVPSLFQESLKVATGFEATWGGCGKPNSEVSMHFGDFRTTSPLLSSPSEQSSVLSASPSSLSMSSDSCSVAEICELLGESPSVCQQDFTFPGLSNSEQQEIFHAARTIQHAFRRRRMQAQKLRHSKEKHAAVLIETYYKKYKEMKQMNQAAGLIQKYYRRYKNSLARSKELERAALFIQQMYRYQHRLKRKNYSL